MSKVLIAMKKQEEIEGLTEDLKEVKKIYEALSNKGDGKIWSSEWSVLVETRFHKYGKHSYQSFRFYYPSKTYLAIKEIQR